MSLTCNYITNLQTITIADARKLSFSEKNKNKLFFPRELY